jgi:hypothetical protein
VLVATFGSQQGLADLIFQMQIATAGKDEERHFPRFDSNVAQGLDRNVDVAAVAAAHHDDLDVAQLAASFGLHNELQRAAIARRRCRKSHAHDVHASGGQLFGYLQLLARGVANARHLFAVAQRLVVNSNLRGIGEFDITRELFGVPNEAFDRLAEHLWAFYGRETISSCLTSGWRSPRRSSAVSRGKSKSSVQSKATRSLRSRPGNRNK